mmetsp:Transcript_25533/g.51891  ORF Transcript_25533/g.51891 Transcript_25533/m.51891 type:complete len:112 (+) Transcript_25533:291-626(+)
MTDLTIASPPSIKTGNRRPWTFQADSHDTCLFVKHLSKTLFSTDVGIVGNPITRAGTPSSELGPITVSGFIAASDPNTAPEAFSALRNRVFFEFWTIYGKRVITGKRKPWC